MVALKPQPADWYIVGAGALGCLWASYLRLAGFKVSLIVRRQQQADSLRQHGLQFSPSPTASAQTIEVDAVSLDELALQQPQLKQVIIATKAYQSLDACQQIQAYLQPQSQILLLQNGLGSQQQVCQQLPQHSIYALVSSDGALFESPNRICHTGQGANQLGLLQGENALNQASNSVFQALQQSQLNLSWQANIEFALLNKFAINCAINALSACLDCRNGELINTENNAKFKALCAEIQLIISALCQQQKLAPIDVYQQALNVVHNTAANSSSMRQDIKLQRRSEISFINAYLVKQAQSLKIACPLNQQLLDKIQELGPKP